MGGKFGATRTGTGYLEILDHPRVSPHPLTSRMRRAGSSPAGDPLREAGGPTQVSGGTSSWWYPEGGVWGGTPGTGFRTQES